MVLFAHKIWAIVKKGRVKLVSNQFNLLTEKGIVFRNFQKTASRWFLTIDWGPISLIYFLGLKCVSKLY